MRVTYTRVGKAAHLSRFLDRAGVSTMTIIPQDNPVATTSSGLYPRSFSMRLDAKIRSQRPSRKSWVVIGEDQQADDYKPVRSSRFSGPEPSPVRHATDSLEGHVSRGDAGSATNLTKKYNANSDRNIGHHSSSILKRFEFFILEALPVNPSMSLQVIARRSYR